MIMVSLTECDLLHQQALEAKSKDQLLMIRIHIQKHHDRIRNLRRFYMEDIKRAEHDSTFQTITFDGSDTRTCQCPQRWRAMQHNDTAENCYVNQKIQTVLMHGRALNMYVCMPFMESGAALTVSTLLDSLEDMDASVEEIRFQFDGMDKFVRYHVSCGMRF
jgi:hypothetical protein